MEANLTDAITQCSDCQTTFKVNEAQILIADSSARCRACLHIFKAQQYFVSPLLDKTERLDIDTEYWSNSDDYELSGIIFSELERPTYFDEIPGDALAEIATAESEAGGDELMEFYMDYLFTHPGILPDLPRAVVVPFGIQFTAKEDQFFGDLQYKEYLTYSEPLEASRA